MTRHYDPPELQPGVFLYLAIRMGLFLPSCGGCKELVRDFSGTLRPLAGRSRHLEALAGIQSLARHPRKIVYYQGDSWRPLQGSNLRQPA